MKLNAKTLLLSVLVAGPMAFNASAVPITLAGFGPSAVTYGFENAAIGAITPGNGFVTFSDGEVMGVSYALGGGVRSYSNIGVVNPPPGGVLRINFASPVSAVGFAAYYNNNPVLFRVFDSSNNLLDSSLTSPTDYGPINGFVGLNTGIANISYALASVPNVDGIHNLFMDNVIYQGQTAASVPEGGSTIALLGLATAAVAGARRKFGI